MGNKEAFVMPWPDRLHLAVSAFSLDRTSLSLRWLLLKAAWQGNGQCIQDRIFGQAPDVKESPAYIAYHAKVVAACVDLMGEKNRSFFDTQCDYIEAFLERRDPAEVAFDEFEAIS